jgi:hypothetical protein
MYINIYIYMHTSLQVSMASFDVAYMQPHEFNEQLKRVFRLNVTSAELGALVREFDENHDGIFMCI